MNFPTPTWLVGCGNMAGAMVEGWRAAGVDLSGVVAIRPSGKAVEGVRVVTSLDQAGAAPELVILGVKPQQLDQVAPAMMHWVTSKTVIVSILAGVEAESLKARFDWAAATVRVMPNLPVSVRRGVIGLYSDNADEAVRDQLSQLFGQLGYAIWVNDEQRLAALGALAGAGPAYVARFVTALAKAGEERGLSAELARTIALETVLGTAWMAATSREDMDALAGRVASPNGTTEAGLAVLDRDQVLDQLIGLVIAAAARRGAELAAEARSGAEVDSDSPLP